ncbi:hypothetical protein Q8F55_000948 [Vanrija albida]|uniref:Trafficking protein particle complex II-specific subunit 65 IgD3 domain-containing protein n=1 Tax=Vanrija albida TaxID=181172 RepID=A0ABR3QFD9_9TREE
MVPPLSSPGLASGDVALESLFHAGSLDLVIPATSALPPLPESRDEGEVAAWWAGVQGLEARDTAFLDEKLSYAVAITFPFALFDGADKPPALTALLSRLVLTATAAFLPPLGGGSTTTTPGLRPPPSAGVTPRTASTVGPPTARPNGLTADGAPPLTPNPVPGTRGNEEEWAGVQGVTVWEGAVEAPDTDPRPVVVRGEEGWVAVWRGELPIVYVRTQIANPVVALTASATLREGGARKRSIAPDTASIVSTTTMQTDIEVDEDEADILAGMQEIDLLGGLGGPEPMPASRLGPSLRDDLFVRLPLGAPAASPLAISPLAPSTTLRQSFRRVLSLSPGLRVRMRTLFLPQIVSPYKDADETEDNGQRRIVLCVEIENSTDAHEHGFEVDAVTVDVGGKGAKATATLVCEPGATPDNAAPSVFPLRLAALEQFNLLYAVEIASSPTGLGGTEPLRNKGDEHRPVSIILSGRPYRNAVFPTAPFQSRWNCALDLGPFYASLPPAPPAPPAPAPRPVNHRHSKPTPPTPNVIAGDKRFSLSTLLAAEPKPAEQQRPGQPPQRRFVSNPVRPIAPPLGNRLASHRGPPPAHLHVPHQNEGHGLLVSVKLLPQAGDRDGKKVGTAGSIRPLGTFSIEIFVHNRTDAVRRFRLAIPARDPVDGRIRELWARKRRRRADEAQYGVDDAVLAALLHQHEAGAAALIPLENDVRCGPLLPGASLAARIRFLALREGVHRIDKLRLTGAGDEFDFVISPVIEVVVGAADTPVAAGEVE